MDVNQIRMSMLAALGQVAHFAVGLGTSPLTIIGLVPIFAAGLAFIRYLSVDPESHPTNIRYVSPPLSKIHSIPSFSFVAPAKHLATVL